MWPELRDQLAVEEAQLRQLFDLHLELLAKYTEITSFAVRMDEKR